MTASRKKKAKTLDAALEHYAAGRTQQAREVCDKVLRRHREDADALHLLGILAYTDGDACQAMRLFRRVVARAPQRSSSHAHLALAYLALSDHAYETIPHDSKTPCRLDAALACARRAVRLNLDDPEGQNTLGVVLMHRGQHEAALPALRKAVELRPSYAEAHNNLGTALGGCGDRRAAIGHFARAVQLKPNFALPWKNLGGAFAEMRNLDEAKRCYETAIQISPQFAEAWNDLGTVHAEQANDEQAADCYRRAIALRPGYAAAHNNLGQALRELGCISEAVGENREAVRLQPDYAEGWNNLGNALRELGELHQAADSYRRAVAANPTFAGFRDNLLMLLGYHALVPPDELLEAHREWNRRHGAAVSERFAVSVRKPEPRRLRVGYVSPHFCDHAVRFFVEPLLRHHDREKVEIYCYDGARKPDAVTERLRPLADVWRPTVDLDDRDMAQTVRDDDIHILVDLAGHTQDNRLRVFSYKPAPVQATYLGYFTTTGLDTMDYWITDDVVTPLHTVERTTEKIYRLPRCWVCYQPPENVPLATARPDGPVSFVCFNNLQKVTPEVLRLWARLLEQVPGSILSLKMRRKRDEASRRRAIDIFEDEGIASERVRFLAYSPTVQEHLQLYNQADIALDPFPYTGGTTTAEALWMGVPVVTLSGSRFIERMSASMLTSVGAEHLIAGTSHEYVEKAAALAADSRAGRAHRGAFRANGQGASVFDPAGLARAMEDAYREMWRGTAPQ